jgi:hypothetical protein
VHALHFDVRGARVTRNGRILVDNSEILRVGASLRWKAQTARGPTSRIGGEVMCLSAGGLATSASNADSGID